MRHPLAYLVLVFSAGIFFSSFIRVPFLALYALGLALLTLNIAFIRQRLLSIFILSLLVLLLGTLFLKNSQTLVPCHISRLLNTDNQGLYNIKGVVASQPLTNSGKLSFIFRASYIESEAGNFRCCGDILVYAPAAGRALSYAEPLVLRGRIYQPLARNKGYLRQQGIYAIMRALPISPLKGKAGDRAFFPRKLAYSLKEKMEAVLRRYTSASQFAILDAMILGEKSGVPRVVYDGMVKTGTVHILVVSGFNVAIVASLTAFLLKLFRVRRRMRYILTFPFLLLYCLLTGASTPVVRATIMAVVFLCAYLLRRAPDIYNSLSASAISILIYNPRQLFDIGAQLSFSSVLAIAYLYPRMRACLRLELLRARLCRFFIDGLLVSFSAWLGTFFFIACNFRIISPITMLANLVVVPLATFITLTGFCLMAMGFFLPRIAPLFASSSDLAVALLLKINAFLAGLPGAYFSLPPP